MGGPPPPKQGMSVATIALIVIVVAIVLGGGSCLMCVCVVGRNAENQNEQDRVDKNHAKNVAVNDLLSDYRANEVRADSHYKNKWIVVRGGQVDQVHSGYITVGTGKSFEIPEVQCFLKPDQMGKAAQLSRGRRVTVRGKGGGLLVHVLLNECEIL